MKNYIETINLMSEIHNKYKNFKDGKLSDVIKDLEGMDKSDLKKILELFIFLQFKRHSSLYISSLRNLTVSYTGEEKKIDFLLSNKFAEILLDNSQENKEILKMMMKENVFFNFFEVCLKELKKSNLEKVKECFDEVNVIDLSKLKSSLPSQLVDFQAVCDLFYILSNTGYYNIANKKTIDSKEFFKEMMQNDKWLSLFVANDMHVVSKFFKEVSRYSYNLVNFLYFSCKNDINPELVENFLIRFKNEMEDCSYEEKRDVVFLMEGTMEKLIRMLDVNIYYNDSPALKELIEKDKIKNYAFLEEYFKKVDFNSIVFNVDVLKNYESEDEDNDRFYYFSLSERDLLLISTIKKNNVNVFNNKSCNDVKREWDHFYNIKDETLFEVTGSEVEEFKRNFVIDLLIELGNYNINGQFINSASEDVQYFKIKKEDVSTYSKDELTSCLKKIMIKCFHFKAMLNMDKYFRNDHSNDNSNYKELLSNSVAKFVMKKDLDELKEVSSTRKRVKKF